MRVALLGEFDAAAPERLAQAGHAVLLDPATGPISEVAQAAEVVVTHLADDRAVRRVYTELARTASAGQVFVDLSPASAATHDWCALALPAFVFTTPGADLRGEPAHIERAGPVLDAVTEPPRLR